MYRVDVLSPAQLQTSPLISNNERRYIHGAGVFCSIYVRSIRTRIYFGSESRRTEDVSVFPRF